MSEASRTGTSASRRSVLREIERSDASSKREGHTFAHATRSVGPRSVQIFHEEANF